MTNYFVWIKNSYGTPEAQIWFGKQKETLAIREMTSEENKIGIRALAEKYPYEEK